MARQFSEKKRNAEYRIQKPVILLITEGRNVTECLYFQQFQQQHSPYNIRILASGSSTDPEGMLDKLDRFWKDHDMDLKKGDKGFVVLDLDCNDQKATLIKKLENGSKFSHFIVSNPCFEIWFLLHYRYTTHAFNNASDVIHELRRHISNYEKTMDVSRLLSDKTDIAYINAKKLEKYFDENGATWPSNQSNPRTDVPDILDVLNHLNRHDIKTKQERSEVN